MPETPLPTTDDQPGHVAPRLPIIGAADRAVTDRHRGRDGGDVIIVPAVNDDEAKGRLWKIETLTGYSLDRYSDLSVLDLSLKVIRFGVLPERRAPGARSVDAVPKNGSPPRGSHRRLS